MHEFKKVSITKFMEESLKNIIMWVYANKYKML
jgi:hypothetical protein